MSESDKKGKPPLDEVTADVPQAPKAAPEDELPTVRISTSLIEQIERANAWLTAPESETTSSSDESMPTLDLPTAEIARAEALAIESAARAAATHPPIVETTIELAAVDIPSIDATLDLPSAEPRATELTVELGGDALSAHLRARALPFQTEREIELPPAALELTADVAPEALALPDVPFAAGVPVASDAELPLGEVGAIAGELEGGSPRAVLDKRGLSHESWIATERRWVARIAAELERGGTALRDAHDDALLAARAKRRGDFGLDAVAELVAELETSRTDASADMGADVADAMRFLRARRRRSAGGAAEMRDAFARARSRRDGRSGTKEAS